MSIQPRPDRSLVAQPIAHVLERLPRMGSVMINTRFRGATHERMGVVDEVSTINGKICCRGQAHDSEIDPQALTAAMIDRTGKMKDKALPRINFNDPDGNVVFSVIGMDGLAPFDAGLEGLTETPATDIADGPSRQAAELGEDDPGAAPFEAMMKAGEPVTIEQSRPGFSQRWTGVIERVSPAMGFINVMRPDFHLHLRGGAVAGWRFEDSAGEPRLAALDAEGELTGLSISGASAALAGIGGA